MSDLLLGSRYSNSLGSRNIFLCSSFNNNTLVVAGRSGTILTSTDGTRWANQASGVTNDLLGIVYGTNSFVAVGTAGIIISSPDGTNWSSRVSGATNDLIGVAYGNNTFVAAGNLVRPELYKGGAVILTSPDGIVWSNRSSQMASEIPVSIVFGGTQFAIAAIYESMWTSSDGITWTKSYHGFDWPIGPLAYGNERFVDIDGICLYISSSNGNVWFKYASFAYELWPLHCIAFGAGRFVAAGSERLMSSEDGTVWTIHPPVTSRRLLGITYWKNRFITVGDAGTIFLSAPFSEASPSIKGNWINGAFELTLMGAMDQTYGIQHTENLSGTPAWQTLVNLTLTNGSATWRDLNTTNRLQRFYRAIH